MVDRGPQLGTLEGLRYVVARSCVSLDQAQCDAGSVGCVGFEQSVAAWALRDQAEETDARRDFDAAHHPPPLEKSVAGAAFVAGVAGSGSGSGWGAGEATGAGVG